VYDEVGVTRWTGARLTQVEHSLVMETRDESKDGNERKAPADHGHQGGEINH